jgi:hypothetical protein
MSELVTSALELAKELNQIRYVYGEECCARVEMALRQANSDDWRSIVNAVLVQWERRRRAYSPHTLSA